MIRRPPRSTLSSSSAASDVYKRQGDTLSRLGTRVTNCYYLNTINVPEINNIATNRNAGETNLNTDIKRLSEEEMKSEEFIENLNKVAETQEENAKERAGGWKYKTKTSSWYIDKNINDGFPILKDLNYE
eukprot:TRINITY_DN3684_c0_g1_i1.p1 TRINITY_DN3684_c0_g1~~TRINITY_DN3684_c0_g1_i1.p1  ORF type:complete len:138 (+),score=28.51 TRINITY_DN3684_c0_g1_i1:25-414(+)